MEDEEENEGNVCEQRIGKYRELIFLGTTENARCLLLFPFSTTVGRVTLRCDGAAQVYSKLGTIMAPHFQ